MKRREREWLEMSAVPTIPGFVALKIAGGCEDLTPAEERAADEAIAAARERLRWRHDPKRLPGSSVEQDGNGDPPCAA